MTQGQFNHISNFDLGCCWLLKVETYFFLSIFKQALELSRFQLLIDT